MILLYVAATLFLGLASYGHYKSSAYAGSQPRPGTTPWYLYSLGGKLSSLGLIALLIGGFVSLSWWVPIVVFLGTAFLSGFIYQAAPLGATYAIIGFPLGALVGLAWAFLK